MFQFICLCYRKHVSKLSTSLLEKMNFQVIFYITGICANDRNYYKSMLNSSFMFYNKQFNVKIWIMKIHCILICERYDEYYHASTCLLNMYGTHILHFSYILLSANK